MKKALILSIFGLAALGNLSAHEPAPIVEARFSYFRPTSHLLREIYGNGGINYEITATVPVWKNLNIWVAADYFSEDGRSLGGHQKTRLRIVPLTLGLKYFFDANKFSPYAGLGMRYFFVHVHNDSSFVNREISRSGMGGVAEIGTLYWLSKHFLLDIFTNYSFKELHAHTSRSGVETHGQQVGGWNFGGGVGYKF
jgi:outer membrane protein W